MLETKWILSERAGRDVGLATAIASYLEQGAPSREGADGAPALDAEVQDADPEVV